MSTPARVALRIGGLLFFCGGLAAIIATLVAGPDAVAIWMGKSCHTGAQDVGDNSWCSYRQVLSIFKDLPFLLLIGAVALVFSYDSDTPQTGPRRRWPLVAVGVMVLTVITCAVGTRVYAAGYTVKREYQTFDEIMRNRPAPPDLSGAQAKAPEAVVAPSGLGRGSLLRPDVLEAALAELRELAPAGARIATLRVSAARIDAELAAGPRTLKVLKPWDGAATVASSAAEPAAGGDRIAFADVDPRAPSRLAGARAADVDYALLMDLAGVHWNVYFTDGRRVSAAA